MISDVTVFTPNQPFAGQLNHIQNVIILGMIPNLGKNQTIYLANPGTNNVTIAHEFGLVVGNNN